MSINSEISKIVKKSAKDEVERFCKTIKENISFLSEIDAAASFKLIVDSMKQSFIENFDKWDSDVKIVFESYKKKLSEINEEIEKKSNDFFNLEKEHNLLIKKSVNKEVKERLSTDFSSHPSIVNAVKDQFVDKISLLYKDMDDLRKEINRRREMLPSETFISDIVSRLLKVEEKMRDIEHPYKLNIHQAGMIKNA